VREYEWGKYSVYERDNIYDLTNKRIYSGIHKYSQYYKNSIQEEERQDSQADKDKKLEERIHELERFVDQKQMKIDYLEKMIDLAKEHYDIDIKKNSDTPQSGGSKIIEKK